MSAIQKAEARRRVRAWAAQAPWTAKTLHAALTWRNPVAAGALSLACVAATSSAIALYRASTLPALLFAALALRIGLPAVPLPQPSSPTDIDAAVADGAAVLATLSEWRALIAQQQATRPAAFTVQAVGTLCVAALAFAHVPTSAVVWVCVCAALVVPGCVASGAVARAQHAAHPSVVRAQQAVVHVLQDFERRIAAH